MLFFFTIFGFFKKHFENKVNKLGYDNGEKIYGHGVGLFSQRKSIKMNNLTNYQRTSVNWFVGSFKSSYKKRWGYLWW